MTVKKRAREKLRLPLPQELCLLSDFGAHLPWEPRVPSMKYRSKVGLFPATVQYSGTTWLEPVWRRKDVLEWFEAHLIDWPENVSALKREWNIAPANDNKNKKKSNCNACAKDTK